MSRRPSAQASKRAPPGLARSVNPFSCKRMSGQPASKAARMMVFSPGDMLGETNTAPRFACSK